MGTGLTNAEELLYNSDPWDASSSNRPPSDINASNLSIAENSAIGTVIGEFNATDPDGDQNHTFSLLYDPKLWLDSSDVRFMRSERNGTGWYPQDGGVVGTWFDRTGNGHHAVAFEDTEYPSYYNMPDYIPDGFNGGLPTIAFRKDLMIVENSAVEFDGWNELTVFAVIEEVRYRTWATWFGKTSGLNSSTDSSWHFMARRPDLSPPSYSFSNK